jgi:hypothetical protein
MAAAQLLRGKRNGVENGSIPVRVLRTFGAVWCCFGDGLLVGAFAWSSLVCGWQDIDCLLDIELIRDI